MRRSHPRLILQVEPGALGLQNLDLSKAVHLSQADLKVTLDDARGFMKAGKLPLDDEHLSALLEQTQGQLEPFLAGLATAQQQAVPLLPSPEGLELTQDHAELIPAEDLLEVLMIQKDWERALEVAVSHLPERVSEVLPKAGAVLREQGRAKRLWQLLAALPHSLLDETILFWRFSAAIRLGRHHELREQIEDYLIDHEAGEVRALYAGQFLRGETQRAALEKAVDEDETAFTLYALGHNLLDHQASLALLQRSLKLAHAKQQAYEEARAAGALAARHIATGQYQEALHWGEWALDLFQSYDFADLYRYMYLLNDYAFARILCGHTAGLLASFEGYSNQLAESSPDALAILQGTQADALVAMGQPAQALPYYRACHAIRDREGLGVTARPLVKALLDVGEVKEAERLASQAYTLTEGAPLLFQREAQLAYGMVLCFSAPERATELLRDVAEQPEVAGWCRAQAALYLCLAQMQLNGRGAAQQVLRQHSQVLKDLHSTGLQLLSGPARAFRDIWPMLQGHQASLELYGLGAARVYAEGVALELAQQVLELITLLALHPDGIRSERLQLELYGDKGSLNALHGLVKKARDKYEIQIDAKPYRLADTVWLDALELGQLLDRGDVSRALNLYKGPLLASSQAPGIRAYQDELETRLRLAVLAEGKPEHLYTLASLFNDDLELWEIVLEQLSASSPLYAKVRAKVDGLHEQYAFQEG